MRVTVSSLNQKKKSILHQSATTPPMYITVENHSFNKECSAVVYTIEIGLQFGGEVEIIKCQKRYSELYQLDKEIEGLFQESIIKPSFPPKKWFGNFDKKFISQRAEKLQNYLTDLCKVNTILKSDQFKSFFGISDDKLCYHMNNA